MGAGVIGGDFWEGACAFMRSAPMRHSRDARSTSSQMAPRAWPLRLAVITRNSRQSLAAADAVDARIAQSEGATSSWGRARWRALTDGMSGRAPSMALRKVGVLARRLSARGLRPSETASRLALASEMRGNPPRPMSWRRPSMVIRWIQDFDPPRATARNRVPPSPCSPGAVIDQTRAEVSLPTFTPLISPLNSWDSVRTRRTGQDRMTLFSALLNKELR